MYVTFNDVHLMLGIKQAERSNMPVNIIVPNTFKIGALTFKIVNNDRHLKISESRASANIREQIVRLPMSNVTQEHLTLLLFHEAVHVIQDTMGDEYDEKFANIFSNFLVEFLTSLGIVFDFTNIKEEQACTH